MPRVQVLLPLPYADIAQSVERILGKDEVTGSNPVSSSRRLATKGLRYMFRGVAQFG